MGKLQGIQLGKQEGLRFGKLEGIQEERQKIMKAMKQAGMTLDQINEIIGENGRE